MTRISDTQTPEAAITRFVARFDPAGIPAQVLAEGRRSLVNIFATAFTGCDEAPIAAMRKTGLAFSSSETCTLIGRPERCDAPTAAALNTAAANIFDFDDTHEATIIHPAAAVFAPLFAHAQVAQVSGRDLLAAFVLGCEVECRMGNAMSPYHYAHGWHITSTCGIFGAAMAMGRLLGLDETGLLHALSCAAAQSSGLVETLGTGAKSVSMGGAARNGYLSALLAQNGCDGPALPLTGPRGYLKVYADAMKPECLTDGLGTEWEFGKNTYKPYPVGVVLNPVIEAVLDLRETDGLRLEQVARITLTGHPLLQQRTNRPDVTTGRETQVSAQHAIAIALLTGRAGLDEFSDPAAARTLKTGRPTVDFIDDDSRAVDSVGFMIRTKDSRDLTRDIDHAAGSRAKPLPDDRLEAKLIAAATRAGFPGDTRALMDALWQVDSAKDAGAIIALAGA